MIAGLKGRFFLLERDSSADPIFGFCSGNMVYAVEIGPLREAVSVNQAYDDWIYIWHVIREDSQILYGFLTPEARALAISMAEADGIGPKLASLAVQTIGVTKLVGFIAACDIEGLKGAMKGLGTKRATELVNHLKNTMTWVAINDRDIETQMAAEKTLKAVGHQVDRQKLGELFKRTPQPTAVELVQRYLQA